MLRLATFLEVPKAKVHDIYYNKRGIGRDAILQLSTGQFVHSNTNVIFQGFIGSGETFLTCAIGKQACKRQIRTRYIGLPDLLVALDEGALVPKGRSKLLKKHCHCGLLIIDEWLLEDISDDEQHFLFELIEWRHDCTSTIVCTQYRKEDWHTRLGRRCSC